MSGATRIPGRPTADRQVGGAMFFPLAVPPSGKWLPLPGGLR